MDIITKCRSCDSEKLEIVWKLEKSPYGDLFKVLRSEALNLESKSLTLIICNSCTLLQLLEQPEIGIIYENYLYRTTVTYALSSYYKQVEIRLVTEYNILKESYIIDIGSNDVPFLINFKQKGFNVIGIEPTKESAQIAKDKGVTTFNGYFDSEACIFVKKQTEKPALISTNYTLANVKDLKQFLILVTELMTNETIFSIVTGYHPDQFAVNMFEYINHDHLSYFTLKSFSVLCESLGLKIIDATRVEHKGGSIQLVVAKNSSTLPIQSSVTQIAQREEWLNCNSREYVFELRDKIDKSKIIINELIDSAQNRPICGVGASISATHLCNQFNISKIIECVFDDDINKIGLHTPGSGILVKSLSNLFEHNNSLLIILAWQHTNRILGRLTELGFKGQVIIPLPNPRIITL
jgi:hypothetical protein